MPGGPQPIDHAQRLRRAQEIVRQIMRHYGDRVLAVGLYGSLARNQDLPFSDIEMHCIMKEADFDHSFEWSAGAWKAEVDVISAETRLQEASTVDVDWPITHGSYVYVLPLHDPTQYFEALRKAVFSPPEQMFSQIIEAVVTGEIYELIGKVRNTTHSGETSSLAAITVKLAQFGACLVGLDQRHLYSSFSKLWDESLNLPNRPKGYDTLCAMVASGKLDSPQQISRAVDHLWEGIEAWAAERGLVIEQQLEHLLKQEKHMWDSHRS